MKKAPKRSAQEVVNALIMHDNALAVAFATGAPYSRVKGRNTVDPETIKNKQAKRESRRPGSSSFLQGHVGTQRFSHKKKAAL